MGLIGINVIGKAEGECLTELTGFQQEDMKRMRDMKKAGLDGINRINVIGKAEGECLTELTGFQQEDMKLMRDMK